MENDGDQKQNKDEPFGYVPFITLSELKPRVGITLLGCNFKCKG